MNLSTGQMLIWGGVALVVLSSERDTQKLQGEPIGPGNPPSQIPWPSGWKRYGGTVGEDMRAAAKADVNDASKRLGTLTHHGIVAETGKAWGVFIEWHWHPKGQGFSAEGWHKGATLVVQK
jgi:hypothetical protein